MTFPCPLCRRAGRIVTLKAELEPDPPLVIVTDLHGDCAHAAAFGELRQTVEETWALIEAALDAASGVDLRPIDAPQSRDQDVHSHRGHVAGGAIHDPTKISGSRRQRNPP